MIPIAICDDELLHARQTQAAIRRCEAQAVTRCFETPLALLAAVTQQGYAPRVAVLDIRMAGMDGIELAKRLNALVPGCAVIFLTAYLSYAPDVYETRHVYFVLKRELDRRIGSALRAALAETAAPASLQLATAHGYRNVPVTDVLFLERILRKTRVVLTDGEELVTAAPAALLEAVPDGVFLRCHQSYLVNLEQVERLEDSCFHMKDGQVIPISRNFYKQSKNAYYHHRLK